MKFHDICAFFYFIDFFVKKVMMNKCFVIEKYTFLPNIMSNEEKLRVPWKEKHLEIYVTCYDIWQQV